jgi:hypothetical protein
MTTLTGVVVVANVKPVVAAACARRADRRGGVDPSPYSRKLQGVVVCRGFSGPSQRPPRPQPDAKPE